MSVMMRSVNHRKKDRQNLKDVAIEINVFQTTNTREAPIAPKLVPNFCFQDVVVNQDGSITLKCKLSDSAKNKVKTYWWKDGEVIKPSLRITVETIANYYNLSVNSITPKDQGVYIFVCNGVFTPIKALLYCKPAKPIIPNGVFYIKAHPRHRMGMQAQLTNSKYYAGETIELQASLKANQIEGFKWFKGNKVVKVGDRTIILNDDKNTSLYIKEAKESDSGIYHVVGQTKYGVESSSAEVIVLKYDQNIQSIGDYIPHVDETFTKTEIAYESEEVRLVYKIDFDNHTKFEWFKDKEIYEPIDNVQVEYYNSRYVALRFLNARVKDTGTYLLAVTNKVNGRLDMCKCKLRVKRLPIWEKIPVKILDNIDCAVTFIGSSIVFKYKIEIEDSQFCYAIWEVGPYRVERSSQQFNVFSRDSEYYLHIKEVEPDMAGLVFCQICKVIPKRKSISLCTSIGNLTIIPLLIDEGISTQYILKTENPGFYYSGTKEVVPVRVTEDQTENDKPETGEQAGPSTTPINLSSYNSQGEDARGNDEVKSKALKKIETPTLRNIKPLDQFICTVKYPSPKNRYYGVQLEKWTGVESRSVPSDKNNDNSMIITYCRLDDSVYWMEATTDCPMIFKQVIVKNGIHECKDTSSGAAEWRQAVVVKWSDFNRHAPVGILFVVEMLDAKDFEGSGITSVPQFKLLDAPAERILKIRVRPHDEIKDYKYYSNIAFQIKHPQLELKRRPTVEMESYKTLFDDTGKNLGRGYYGKVNLVRCFDGTYYAAKRLEIINYRRRMQAKREYSILAGLAHPNFVRMHLAFSGNDQTILIMDYLRGGGLFERLVQEFPIKEEDVIFYMRQLCKGLVYLHSNDIIHMDIKPENILCDSPNNRQVKIADFGNVHHLHDCNELRTMYGTKEFMAPEVVKYNKLTTGCDMWSLGVTAYFLLSGAYPFTGSDWNELLESITRGVFNYDNPAFINISDLAKDFINKLIKPCPHCRMTAKMALEHKWLKEDTSQYSGNNPLKQIKDNVRDFIAKSRERWQMVGIAFSPAHRFCIESQRLRSTVNYVQNSVHRLDNSAHHLSNSAHNLRNSVHHLRNAVQQMSQSEEQI